MAVVDVVPGGADAVAKEIVEAGGQARAFDVDLSSRDEIERLVADVVAAFGGLDILVTNAGGPPPGPFTSTEVDAYPAAISLNLMSVSLGNFFTSGVNFFIRDESGQPLLEGAE